MPPSIEISILEPVTRFTSFLIISRYTHQKTFYHSPSLPNGVKLGYSQSHKNTSLISPGCQSHRITDLVVSFQMEAETEREIIRSVVYMSGSGDIC